MPTWEPGELGISYSDDFTSYYKIAGFTVFNNYRETFIMRTTYDGFSALSDFGGFIIALVILVVLLSSFVFSTYAKAYFMSKLFY